MEEGHTRDGIPSLTSRQAVLLGPQRKVSGEQCLTSPTNILSSPFWPYMLAITQKHSSSLGCSSIQVSTLSGD